MTVPLKYPAFKFDMFRYTEDEFMETLDWKPTRKSIKQKHFILRFHQIHNYRLLKNYTIPNNG